MIHCEWIRYQIKKSNIEHKTWEANENYNHIPMYPFAPSFCVGLDASPLDSLILLSYSLSLVIPDMLSSDESSSGLLGSDFLDGPWEVTLGSWEVSLEWDLTDPLLGFGSTDGERWDRDPT